MSKIVDILENDVEGIKNAILSEMHTRLADQVNDKLSTQENTLDENIDELKNKLENISDCEYSTEQINELKESLMFFEDMKYGLILEGEETDLEIQNVRQLTIQSRMMGGSDVTYNEGVLYVEFKNKQSVYDFTDWLEVQDDTIIGYEITILSSDGTEEDSYVDLTDIKDDVNLIYAVVVYLEPSIVQYADYELEVDDFEEIEEENGQIFEVIRKVKINFRGKKRIKMKCTRGFKWDTEKKSCVKIAGDQLAKMRKSLRRAVLTKRSKGTAFKTRVLRKTRKAKRFRKMMGLQS